MKRRKKQQGSRDRLLERFHAAVDHGDEDRARPLLRKIEAGGDDAFAAYARWRLGSMAEELEPAVEVLRADVARFPEEPDLQHALGLALLELDRPTDAIPHLEEACYLDGDFADAWHDLGFARERTGDLAGMKQAFAEVFEIDTAPDPPPPRFSTDQVVRWAERAMQALPEDVQQALPDMPIFVQDYPDPWILEAPPWDPRLLGLFDGPTLAEMRGMDAPADSPHIYLYQQNLERLCFDSREMAEQVRITLHHEVGHFLGLGEVDLDERGLA